MTLIFKSWATAWARPLTVIIRLTANSRRLTRTLLKSLAANQRLKLKSWKSQGLNKIMEEYFDIVDENNQQTGEKRLRFEAHTLGLWHRTVHIYFFRQKDNQIEFLVHLRSKYKDLHPNCWDTRFGGHLKSGETIEKTVINEIKEELGLEIDLNSLIKGSVHKRDKKTNRERSEE